MQLFLLFCFASSFPFLVSAEQSKYVHTLKGCAHQEGESHEDERGSCCKQVKLSLEHSTNVEEYCWVQIFLSECVKHAK